MARKIANAGQAACFVAMFMCGFNASSSAGLVVNDTAHPEHAVRDRIASSSM
jgi:hypothetical protein